MRKLTRDGVALAYDVAGSGDPPLLLVHGWTCDHTYFAPQFEQFRRDHRVITVDLRGHGESDKPEQAYTMAGFADDLAWLCRALALEKPVVIGHSMGGTIALVLAAHHPELPAAVALIDSSILPSRERRDASLAHVERLRGPDYREAQRRYVGEGMFLPTDDPERKAHILDQMSSAPRHVMASALQDSFANDWSDAIAACRVPTLYVNAAWPRPELDRFRELCPQLVTGQTVGAGHFCQLEVPDQVNAMLARFLAISAPG